MKGAAFFVCALLAGCATLPESAPPAGAPVAPIASEHVAAEPVAVRPAWVQPAALEAAPAAVPMPPAPPIQKAVRDGGSLPRDQSGELTRNASVVCRLPEAGQRASFPFTAEAGEQSLFELAASAYSRAASGRVRIAIEDAEGRVAWQSERDVAVVWRDFTGFTPDHAGSWTYSLTMLEGGYRFVLVRHSNYPPLATTALDLGAKNLVHGELPSADAVASYRVLVHAGEELALKLLGTREEARDEARRGATEMGAMVSRMELQPAGGRMAGGAKLQFQRFDLEVLENGAPLAAAASYVRFKAARDGSVEVRVRARYAAGGGGLFDLSVERPLELLRVHGVVVDADDQPLQDVEVNFLREPDADLVGSARTNAAGEYDATVLAGNLAIQMVSGQFAASDTVRIHAAADAQVDLIFQPGAKLRRR